MRTRTTLRLSEIEIALLAEIKKNTGIKTNAAAIRYIIGYYAELDKRCQEVLLKNSEMKKELKNIKDELKLYFGTKEALRGRVENKSLHILYCSECGSLDVNIKMWVNPNNSEISGYCSDETEEEDCWCNRCEQNVKLLTISEISLPEGLKRIEKNENR